MWLVGRLAHKSYRAKNQEFAFRTPSAAVRPGGSPRSLIAGQHPVPRGAKVMDAYV